MLQAKYVMDIGLCIIAFFGRRRVYKSSAFFLNNNLRRFATKGDIEQFLEQFFDVYNYVSIQAKA